MVLILYLFISLRSNAILGNLFLPDLLKCIHNCFEHFLIILSICILASYLTRFICLSVKTHWGRLGLGALPEISLTNHFSFRNRWVIPLHSVFLLCVCMCVRACMLRCVCVRACVWLYYSVSSSGFRRLFCDIFAALFGQVHSFCYVNTCRCWKRQLC